MDNFFMIYTIGILYIIQTYVNFRSFFDIFSKWSVKKLLLWLIPFIWIPILIKFCIKSFIKRAKKVGWDGE